MSPFFKFFKNIYLKRECLKFGHERKKRKEIVDPITFFFTHALGRMNNNLFVLFLKMREIKNKPSNFLS